MNPGHRYAFHILVPGDEHFSTVSLRKAALAALMLAGCAPSLSAAQTPAVADPAKGVQWLASRHASPDVDMMDSVLEVEPPARAVRHDATRLKARATRRHVARGTAFGMNTAPIRRAGSAHALDDRAYPGGGAIRIDSTTMRAKQATSVAGVRIIEESGTPRASALHDAEPDPWSSAWFAPREVMHGAALRDEPYTVSDSATSSSHDDWTQLSAAQPALGTMNDRLVW